MHVIYKYDLHALRHGICEVEMPQGAVVLTAHEQNQSIYIWAEVNTGAPTETRQFQVLATGEPFMRPRSDQYIASVYMGSYVWHVYELLPVGVGLHHDGGSPL